MSFASRITGKVPADSSLSRSWSVWCLSGPCSSPRQCSTSVCRNKSLSPVSRKATRGCHSIRTVSSSSTDRLGSMSASSMAITKSGGFFGSSLWFFPKSVTSASMNSANMSTRFSRCFSASSSSTVYASMSSFAPRSFTFPSHPSATARRSFCHALRASSTPSPRAWKCQAAGSFSAFPSPSSHSTTRSNRPTMWKSRLVEGGSGCRSRRPTGTTCPRRSSDSLMSVWTGGRSLRKGRRQKSRIVKSSAVLPEPRPPSMRRTRL